MERLTDEFMASCPRDGGLILRGHSMTRIETFVDAAFGVLCLAAIVIALYLNGLRFREQLRLTDIEVFVSWKRITSAAVVGVTATGCMFASGFLTEEALAWSGLWLHEPVRHHAARLTDFSALLSTAWPIGMRSYFDELV